MKLGDMPVHPMPNLHIKGTVSALDQTIKRPGLTLRQHYAGLAMQSLLTSMYGSIFAEAFKRGEIGKTNAANATALRNLITEASLTFADELCAALENSNEPR